MPAAATEQSSQNSGFQLDLLLHNANVLTMDPWRPRATSIGVLGGRILGMDDDVASLTAREEVDLRGACVTPGFIDAHCHTTWFGLGLAEVDVSKVRGVEAIYSLLAEAAAMERDDGSADGWIMATGFNQKDHFGEFPDIAKLDAVTAGRPLFIRHTSGHMAVVNSAALRLAGADIAGFPDPDGGVIVRDDDGNPTGLVQETAQNLIQDLIRPYPRDAIVAALERATAQYAREGITSFTEAGIGGGWIGHSPAEFSAYFFAQRTGQLHARAQLMPTIDVLHSINAAESDVFGNGLDLGIASGFGNDYLSLGPVKVFLDGSLIGETAAMSEDYCSHPGAGRGYFQADPLAMWEQILDAYRSGWAIAAHAIGDRAVGLAIDVLTECRERYGAPVVPNRIEHCSLTRPDQMKPLADAGIAVTPQASFFFSMGDQITRELGEERSNWAYRARSFIDAGIRMAGSSDRPVADGQPLRGMQAFVDRQTDSGQTFGDPGEFITAAEALAAYTTVAAEATGLADSRGSITPGKLADFAVLAEDPTDVPTDRISGIAVLATMVGGKFTHNELHAFRS
nr:amidohydrolase [Arthrobacter sp. H14]